MCPCASWSTISPCHSLGMLVCLLKWNGYLKVSLLAAHQEPLFAAECLLQLNDWAYAGARCFWPEEKPFGKKLMIHWGVCWLSPKITVLLATAILFPLEFKYCVTWRGNPQTKKQKNNKIQATVKWSWSEQRKNTCYTWNLLIIVASFCYISHMELQVMRSRDRCLWDWSWSQCFQKGNMNLLLT